jgi:hypothetical protein
MWVELNTRDDRSGDELFYDINALSNFIADAENVIGLTLLKTWFISTNIYTNKKSYYMRYGYWLPVFGGWLRNVEMKRWKPVGVM